MLTSIGVLYFALNKDNIIQVTRSDIKEKNKQIPQYVVNNIQNNRLIELESDEVRKNNFKHFLYNYKDFKEELSENEINCNFENEKVRITKDQALQDVEHMFKILKYSYAGYQYFGGDTKFNGVKSSIINIVNKSENWIVVKDFNKILCDNLNFIQDGHFLIGNKNTCVFKCYYYNEEYSFNKDNKGYFTIIDKDKYYLVEVNNEDPEKYLKISLNKNGDIVYNLGLIEKKDKYSVEIKIELRANDRTMEKTLILNKEKEQNVKSQKAYSFVEKSGIPIN